MLSRGRVLLTKGKVRKTVPALLSLLVAAGAVAYVWAPSRQVLSVRVTNVATAHDAGKGHAGHGARTAGEVIYGKVSGTHGSAPESGSVWVLKDGQVLSSVTINADGTFRSPLSLPRGDYRLVVRAEFGGHWYQGSKFVTLRPGRAYAVYAVLRPEGVFTIFPVGSY